MSRTLRDLGIVLAVGLLALTTTVGRARGAQSNSPAAMIDVDTVGPKVGERVPAFSLMDQTGKDRTLESIMGPNGAMLVFFRSADW